MDLSDESRVSVTDRQVACEVGEEAVILHLDDGIYYGLNEVGARIWQLVQEPRTVSEIVDAIVAEYDVAPEQCRVDVRDLLGELLERKLVVLRDGAGH